MFTIPQRPRHLRLVLPATLAAAATAAAGFLILAPGDEGSHVRTVSAASTPATDQVHSAGDDVRRGSENRAAATVGGDSASGEFTVTDQYGNPVDPYPSETIVGGDDPTGGFTVTDQYGNPVDPYPSETIVGGDDPTGGFTVTDQYGNPVDPYPSETIVGGDDPTGGFTVIDQYGNPVDPYQIETIVGGDTLAPSSSAIDALMHLYAQLPVGSTEQVWVSEMIASINASTEVWLTDDRDADGIPDHRDSYVG